MTSLPKISFVIPVYMNEKEITFTFNAIKNLFETIQTKFDFEILFVNDGSRDQSLQEIKSLKQNYNNRVKYISFSRNFGQVPAIIAGIRHCKGDCAVVISADLQDPIDLVLSMIENWFRGNEIVVGFRTDREDGFLSKITSRFFYRLMKVGNPLMPEGGFDCVLLGKKAIGEFNKIDERNRFFQSDILWLGFGIKFIPYKRLKRKIGKSRWTIGKKIKYFLDGTLNTSYFIIRIFSFLGLITALSGFLYSLLIVYNRFMHKTPFTGWSPIMIVILLIGGLIMLMLGIIGEYLWRIYDEVRNRELYVIDESALG